MARTITFALNEWYHCYTRSIDSKTVFKTEKDFQYFLQAIYISNSTIKINHSALRNTPYETIFSLQRGDPLVAIGAYALMPNHFHLLVQEKEIGGVSRFMQKLGTSFAMYFNIKYSHIGNVFIKPFRAKHIIDDKYLRRVRQYIHLNPAELFEPDWKLGQVSDMKRLEANLLAYPYTSIPDYYSSHSRLETALLNKDAIDFLREAPPLMAVLEEAWEYYSQLGV